MLGLFFMTVGMGLNLAAIGANLGTVVMLLAGLLATHPFAAVMTGDGSLRRRPMARITEPLGQFGARFVARSGTRLPLTIMGAAEPVPITYRVPVASAQVKSAVLLAGLNTPGRTVVVERTPTRDYTETMLGAVGAAVVTEVVPAAEGGGHRISLDGQPVLVAPPDPVTVPGDVSSAAFLIVLAAILPDSDLVLDGIGLNPRRTGLIDTLLEMGADLEITDRRQTGGEEIGAVRVRSAPLRGVAVPPSRVAAMIDEYPILCIAAAAADGETRMAGVGELRVKESDRIQLMQAGLAACGVTVASGPDWLSVTGAGAAARVPGGARVETALDHRIAMSFLVLGCAAKAPVEIDDLAPIQTSFPGFADVIAGLAPAPPIEALADGSTP